MSAKIQSQHTEKPAYIYLRQSTMAQVRHNQESTERQYALRDKARQLGWPPEKTRILDGDLGVSGAQTAGRNDFKALVADVSMGKVGAVFALEASRLARSCTDWHRLLELCALADTLIIDEDGCYRRTHRTRALEHRESGIQRVGPRMARTRPKASAPQTAHRQILLPPNSSGILRPASASRITEAHRETVETGFAPACAVFLRRRALEEVGLFDESLFMNWEDYDLCCRFQDAGWKLITMGQAEVVHAHGQSQGKVSPFITYFLTRNRLICLFRYAPFGAIVRRSPFILQTFSWKVRGHGLTNWAAHMAFLKGVVHFLLGVRGDHAPKNTKDPNRGR